MHHGRSHGGGPLAGRFTGGVRTHSLALPNSGAPSVAARWGHLHQPPQDAGAHVIERPQDLMALLRP
jgi:hypothetical protein